MRLNMRVLAMVMFVLVICTGANGQVIQSSGAGTGNWNDPASWTPNTVPTNANSSSIIINVGHTISVNANFTADQLTNNGTLLVNTGQVFTLANGAGTDLTNTGTITVSGTLVGSDGYTFSGLTAVNTSFAAGSVYQHGYKTSEGAIPLATWNAASTLNIIGFTASITATAAGNWSQSFGHVIYSCNQGPSTVVNLAGQLTSIQGDFSVLSTGPNAVNRLNFSVAENVVVNIGGSLTISGGSRVGLSNSATNFVLNIANDFVLTSTNASGSYAGLSGKATINVGRDFIINNGAKFGLTNEVTAVTDINLIRHFDLISGTLTGKSGSTANINFTGVSVQNFINTGSMQGKVSLNIQAGSTVNFGTQIATGSGNFTLSGTIRLGSTDVLGAYQNGSTGGNIRLIGTRTSNVGSVVEFNGLAKQYINGSTPANSNVIINNAASVELVNNLTVTGTLTLQTGSLILVDKTLAISGPFNTVGGTLQTTSASNLSIAGTGSFNHIAFANNPASVNNLSLNRTGLDFDINSDLIIAGTASVLSNVIFNFIGQSVTLSGPMTANSNARWASSSTSSLTINGSGSLGIFRFHVTNHNLNNWTVNRASSIVRLGTVLNLSGVLNIQSTNTQFQAGSGLTLLSTNDNPTADASIATLPSGSNVTGSVTVNRYMSAEGDLNRYISSPVAGATVASLQDDFPVTGRNGGFTGQSNPCAGCSAAYNLKYFDESFPGPFTAQNNYEVYPKTTNLETLQVGRGYVVYMWNGENQITWDVSGTINQGTIALPVSHTPSSPPQPGQDGWNLVGNPYPSTIRWDDVVGWTANNMFSTVYVSDESQRPAVFRSWNPVDNTGDLAGGLIATGQAFWVFANAPGASLSIHETAKAASGSGAFYRRSNNSESQSLIVSLQEKGSTVKDNSYLILNSDAQDGLDSRLEVPKLENPSFDIALIDNENLRLGRLAVRELVDESYPVSIRVTESGDYVISFSQPEVFAKLKLVDLYTGKISEISQPYSFSTAAGRYDDRFVLKALTEGIEVNLEEVVRVFPNPVINKLKITAPSDVMTVNIINSMGLVVKSETIKKHEDQFELDVTNYTVGVYYIKVQIGTNWVTRKVLKK